MKSFIHQIHMLWLRYQGRKELARVTAMFERQEADARRRGDCRAIGNVREARRDFQNANLRRAVGQ